MLISGQPVRLELAFTDHVRRLDSSERWGGGWHGLERQHRAGDAFDEAVVLLDDLVELLDLQDFDRPTGSGEFEDCIHHRDVGQIGTAFVDHHPVGLTVACDRAPDGYGRSSSSALHDPRRRPLCQDLIKIAVGNRIADVEENNMKNDRPRKLSFLELDLLKYLRRPTLAVSSSPCHCNKTRGSLKIATEPSGRVNATTDAAQSRNA